MGRKAKNAQKLIEYLYQVPIINVNQGAELLKLSRSATFNLFNDLINLELLNEMTDNRRYRKFTLKKYYQLFLR